MSTAATNLLDPRFLAQLEQLELVSRKIFTGQLKGERRSKRKGQSVEFADYRNYVKGDDLRFLDWNLYARLDRLFIRLFMEEEDLHFYVLVDTSASMGFGTPNKLRYASQVAAALAFVGLVNNDRVVVETFNDRLSRGLPALRGRHNLRRVLDFFSSLEPTGGSNLRDALRTFTLKATGKGVAVLLSDFMDKGGYDDALRYLVSRQYDLHLIQVLSPEELDPPLVGDLKLIDAEDQDEAELTMSGPVLKRYKQNLAAFQQGLQSYCTKRGIGFLATSTAVPFDRLILSYFRRQGLLR